MNFENQIIKSKEKLNNQWVVSSPRASDAAIILDILEFITKSTSLQLERELIVTNNNKLLNSDVQDIWEKAEHYTNEFRGTPTKIKELIKGMAFTAKAL